VNPQPKPLSWLWIGLALSGSLFAPSFSTAQSTPVNASVSFDQLQTQAQELELQGQWERAFQLYCRLLSMDRQQPGLRDRMFVCLRHVLQVRRHRDPSFQEKVLALPFTKALDLYAEVIFKLQGHYVDRDRSIPSRLLQTGFDEFLTALNDPGFRRLHLAEQSEDTIRQFATLLRDAWATRTVRDSRDARTIVREVALAAQRDLRLVNPVIVVMEFMAGACNALDEYTAYLTPGQLLAEASRPLMELWSFGLQIAIRGDRLIIADVREDSLAQHTIIREGDQIVRINKTKLKNPTPEKVAEALRGANGFIDLEFMPAEGAGPGYTIRIPAQLPTVIGTSLLKDGVGYVHLIGFRDSTLQELDDSILSLKGRGMKVLILDLRGNPGGLFLPAVQSAERFLGEGIIVTTQGQLDEFNKTYTSTTGMTAHAFPLIILVDGETASGAEILASAMKENQRAILIGTVTYGKGTIQVYRPVDSGAVRITVARFYSPTGLPLSHQGVTPNILEPVRERQLELAIEQALRHLGMGMNPPGMRMEMMVRP